jgi:soluble lytic murein transglycosylase-like protein
MLGQRCKTTPLGRILVASLCASILASASSATAITDNLAPAERSADDRGVIADQTLPRLLGAEDAGLYRRIFRVQGNGDFSTAERLIGELRDRTLLGHVLWQRYMHPRYRASYAELAAWLSQYTDHPGADRIYALALRRHPAGTALPPRPMPGYLGGSGQEGPERTRIDYQSELERTPAAAAAVNGWRRQIDQLIGAGRPEAAEALLQQTEIVALIDRVEADLGRWTVARGYFAAGNYGRALALAGRAAARSGDAVPELHWIAGLSAWQLGQVRVAACHFAALADAPSTLPDERARAAFWAARAYLVAIRPQLAQHYLELAAPGGDFYALLARAVLGRPLADDGQQVALEDILPQILTRFPGARRAAALGQLGEFDRAEQEIRKLAARASADVMSGLIGLAQSLDLPAAQMRLAQSLRSSEGRFHFAALYPLPSWQPANGYTVDRALVYSIMRAESAFDPTAESDAGAQGLMQVMPDTARQIAALGVLRTPQADDLFEPETSIQFGQAYLEYLLQWSPIGSNLIYLAAAYNAGPGRVSRWQEQLGIDGDPLLFLESIPMREPRVYVKKVLANLWSYRARLGQPQPELEALAHNRWPRYQALDVHEQQQVHAWN